MGWGRGPAMEEVAGRLAGSMAMPGMEVVVLVRSGQSRGVGSRERGRC